MKNNENIKNAVQLVSFETENESVARKTRHNKKLEMRQMVCCHLWITIITMGRE